jgi:hypothetical protein
MASNDSEVTYPQKITFGELFIRSANSSKLAD